ncbi:hypothetical protein [Nocardiopsis ansamitocini]|nr:hypothetical protein [Nocardiopsis ansamitocini]
MSLWPPPRSTRHSNRRPKILLGAAAGLVVLLAAAGVTTWALLPGEEAAAPLREAIPDPYTGSWSGEMSQRDAEGALVIDWGAKLKLDAGTNRGSADWFTLGCRGSVTLTENTGDSLVFDYVETYDPDNRCVDESVLTLTLGSAPDTLEAQWVAVSHGGTQMTSEGTLK